MKINHFVKQYQITFSVISIILISISAQIVVKVPLFDTEIPFTLQTLSILIVGFSTKKFWGWASTLAYLILGLIGLPIFAEGSSGLSKLTGVTGGYLVGFVLAAWFMSQLRVKKWHLNNFKIFYAMLLGTLLILFCGWSWLSYHLGPLHAFLKGILPFIPGAIIKIVLGAIPFVILKELKNKRG